MGSTLDKGSGINTDPLAGQFEKCAINAVKENMPQGATLKGPEVIDDTHKMIAGSTQKPDDNGHKIYNGIVIEMTTDAKGTLVESLISSRNEGSPHPGIKDGVVTNVNTERDVAKPAALESIPTRDTTKKQVETNEARAIKTLNDIRACMKTPGL